MLDSLGDKARFRAVIIAPDSAAMDDSRRAVALAGGTCIGEWPTDTALGRLGDHPETDLICLELTADTDMPLALLDRLDAGARSNRHGAVIGFPFAVLDAVAGSVTAPKVSLLCAPTIAERAAAMALQAIGGGHLFHQPAIDQQADRIQRLADEVARIAASLASLAGAQEDQDMRAGGDAFSDGMIGYRAPPVTLSAPAREAVTAATVRQAIRNRRLRERFFEPELFADPAWDILLDLFAAGIERQRVAVSSLCIAAAVPPTTALRMIATMTEKGMLVRVNDPLDRRRVFVELSAGTRDAMQAYFAASQT